MAGNRDRYRDHIKAAVVAIVVGAVFGLLLSLLHTSQPVTFGVAIIVGLLILAGLEAWERRQKRIEVPERVKAHLDLYAEIFSEGETHLIALEEAIEHSVPPWAATLEELFNASQLVLVCVENGQGWMAKAEDEIAKRVRKPTAVLFAANRATRPKPGYVENEPELGIWQKMAGRLDWLKAQIKQDSQ